MVDRISLALTYLLFFVAEESGAIQNTPAAMSLTFLSAYQVASGDGREGGAIGRLRGGGRGGKSPDMTTPTTDSSHCS